MEICRMNNSGTKSIREKSPEAGAAALPETSRWLLAGLLLMLSTGCTDSAKSPEAGAKPSSTAPAVAKALDNSTTYRITPSELRKKLGANERAKFRVSGNDIVRAELFQSGIRSIEPLRGVPLEYLDLGMTDVTDLSPLASMPLRELILENTPVADISVLKGMKLEGIKLQNTKVTDLSALKGMPIRELNLMGVPVQDLAQFSEMPLSTLWVPQTQVSDLSPIAGCRLASLDIQNTKVSSLEPLRGMTSLERLNIADTEVTDVTPLKDLQLQRLTLTPSRITAGMEVLRSMKTLTEFRPSTTASMTAETSIGRDEFWKRFDLGVYTEIAVEGPAESATPSETKDAENAAGDKPTEDSAPADAEKTPAGDAESGS
jgi:internalin A